MTDLEMRKLHADLEMTKLCAEAMGAEVMNQTTMTGFVIHYPAIGTEYFDPLHDDAQAMALVKKFKLSIADQTHGVYANEAAWSVWYYVDEKRSSGVQDHDLNRAIVECVARMSKI